MRIWTQKSASIQKRTSPLKFDNFAEKSEKDTVSYLSSKALTVARETRDAMWRARLEAVEAREEARLDAAGAAEAAALQLTEQRFASS